MADKKRVASGGGPTAPRRSIVRVQWQPTGSNQTTVREIDPYTWDRPGAVVEVELSWWKEYEERLLTSPREEFTRLTAEEAEELAEAEAQQPPVEEPTEGAMSNPTPAPGE
jgi:hypothetical protein